MIDEDPNKEGTSLKEHVNQLRIAMAVLKTEMTSFKYMVIAATVSNIAITVVVNVQV